MAMIRQADLDTSPRQALVLNVENIRAQAELIMSQTRQAAAAVIAQANAERQRILAGAAEAGRAQGHAEGLARGLAEGREKGAAQARAEAAQRLTALESSWTAALTDFLAARDGMLRDCEQRALELAILMGERIARRAIAVEPSAALSQVAGILELATRGSRLTIAINPGDAALIRDALPALIALDAQQRHVEVLPDASVPQGSCLARCEGGGELDARLDTMITGLVREILPGAAPAAPAADPAPLTLLADPQEPTP